MITYRQPFKGDWPITQGYGEKDTSDFHTGIDYGCPLGTEILASADGTVVFSGWNNLGWGNLVIIQHKDKRATVYAHLQRIIVGPGRDVKQSEPIGYSGSTGNSTGPHLHFEARTVWSDVKSHIDPMLLPLQSFADTQSAEAKVQQEKPLLRAGVYRIGCQYAFVRLWDTLIRDHVLMKGDRVYIFDDVKRNEGGLPFHYIGAGLCIAEYDSDGTQILEAIDG